MPSALPLCRIAEKDLRRFLVAAKRATFAGEMRSRRRAHEKSYRYVDGRFAYRDGYFGNSVDTGIEVVRYDGYPVWTMVYRGGLVDPADVRRRDVFAFLRAALRKVTAAMPMRGPSVVQDGVWVYKNRVIGALGSFHGSEGVYCGRMRVAWRLYQGGIVRDTHFGVEIV